MVNIKEVFRKLRNNELSGNKSNDLNLLDDLMDAIKSKDGFVLGSFTFTEHSIGSHKDANIERKFWPENYPHLFYGLSIDDDQFKAKATEAFNILKTNKLFISTLIHQLDDKRAKRVELIHRYQAENCLPLIHDETCLNNCNCKIHSEDWVLKNTLTNLPNSFPQVEHNKIANSYVKTVESYFPNNRNHLIVYCPFFVPDGKPPGNFFGVFECIDKCHEILDFLSDLQLAGTLVFSRKAIDAKLENIMTEVNRLRGVLEPIQEMTYAINNLEGVVNTNSLALGDEEYKQLRKARLLSWGSACHTVAKWDDQCKDEFNTWLQGQKSVFSKLKGRLGDERYRKYFSEVENVLNNNVNKLQKDQLQKAGFIIKYVLQGTCPCEWAGVSEKRAIETAKDEISPLNFILAIEALGTYCNVSSDKDKVNIDVSVPCKDDSKEGLQKLLDAINDKKMKDVCSLYKGNTSSAIALLAKAAYEEEKGAAISDGKLKARYVYFTKEYE